jgi:hypothetical protein
VPGSDGRMGRREARRRAWYIAAELIEGDIEAGLDLASYTGDGSGAQARLLEAELRAIASRLRRRLPAGWRFDQKEETGGGK